MIKDQNTQGTAGNNAQDSASQQPGGGQQQQQSQQQAGPRAFSFNNMGNSLNNRGVLMGRNPASEHLTKLTKALQERVEGADPSYEVKIIPVDKDNARNLSLSVIIVAVRDTLAPDLGVAAHTLLLEGSVDQIPAKFEPINGQNVEIIRVASDAWDAETKKVVVEAVKRNFQNCVGVLDADAEVVSRNFNVGDAQSVHLLAANAGIAAQSRLNQAHPDFNDLNLAGAAADATLSARAIFHQGASREVADIQGQPQSADITIEFSAVSNQQQNQQLALDRSTTLSRISGFLDFVWAPDAAVAQANPWVQTQGVQSYQRYAQRFVATSMESTDLLTIPAQLLSLLAINTLRENNAWFRGHEADRNVVGLDLNDVGAIGIEANFEGNPSGYGARIDTKADNFNLGTLGKLLSATVKQGLMISLDVPECGAATWYNGVFSAAAEGSKKAYDAIYNGANVLTNGAFSREFQYGSPIVGDEYNRIHLGTYQDANGLHDVRRITYLAVLNVVGERDPQIVRDWSDTFLRVEYPLAQRLAARKKLMVAMFGDSVNITGFARRVTFTAAFIDALTRAAKAAGLVVRNTTQVGEVSGFERATAQGLDQTLLSGNSAGLFAYTGYGAAANGAGMRSAFNRWS